MAEVLPELRVPFSTEPIHVEAWLRAEKPGAERLARLIASQPESYRPQLRRILKAAAEQIAADGTPGIAALEDRNHMSHLEESGVFDIEDPVVVDPEADRLAVLQAKDDEIAELLARLAERDEHPAAAETDGATFPEPADPGIPTREGPGPVPVDPPTPEAEASADLLDAVLEEDDLEDLDLADPDEQVDPADADLDDPLIAGLIESADPAPTTEELEARQGDA